MERKFKAINAATRAARRSSSNVRNTNLVLRVCPWRAGHHDDG
jgi:hypothetical protein